MIRFKQFLQESKLQQHEWDNNPKIGWWADHDHYHMYHGTHHSRLDSIAKHGIKAPEKGPTAGWVSASHDAHTAHGYASMTGGESAFRAAGAKAKTVPHNERAVLHLKIPKDWAHKNMNHQMRGNVGNVKDNLTNKQKYLDHKKAGKADHEYYATTELRFKNHIPKEFITGYSKKVK